METQVALVAPPAPAPGRRFDDSEAGARELLMGVIHAFWTQVRGWLEKEGVTPARWEACVIGLIDQGWIRPQLIDTEDGFRAQMLFWDGDGYRSLEDIDPDRQEFLIDLFRPRKGEEHAA